MAKRFFGSNIKRKRKKRQLKTRRNRHFIDYSIVSLNKECELPDSRIAVNALELNPNNLAEDLEGKEGDRQVISMLLAGNYLGALRIIYFHK